MRGGGRGALVAAALLALGCSGGGGGTTVPPGEPDDRDVYGDARMRVERVIDGDTAVLEDGTSVRYIGIDTPETDPDQCFAEAATAANDARVEGRLVTIRLDPAETRDRFGRLLAYLELDGSVVNVELVREGFACAFPFGETRRYRDEIAAAEADARAAGRGLWAVCPPIPDGCPPAE